MRHAVASLIVIVVLLTTATSSTAQTITTYDMNGPRLGGGVSYGGHGLDGEISLDTRTLWNHFQIRASVAQGRWVGVERTVPPAGTDPTVSRAAISIIKNGRFDPYAPVRLFGGLGVGVLVPRGVKMSTVAGFHALGGIEAVGDRWSLGPEIQIDGPLRHPDPLTLERPGQFLSLTARIGFFVRRRL
jgi:hypothetical protein